MARRIFWIISLMALLLAACGENDKQSEPEPVSEISIPAKLLVWHSFEGEDQQAIDELGLDFSLAHPGIALTLEYVPADQLQTRFDETVLAGAGPDMLIGPQTWIEALGQAGLIQPISFELYEQLTQNVHVMLRSGTALDEMPYGTALGANFPVIYLNNSQFSFDIPHTFEGLIELARVRIEIQPTFFATSALYLSDGHRLRDEQGENLVTEAAFTAYLERLQELVAIPGVQFTDDNSAFEQGEHGILMATAADYARLSAARGDDLQVLAPPDVGNDNWDALVTLDSALMISLNATAESVQAAEEFCMFMTGADAQRLWLEQTGRPPVNPTGITDTMVRDAFWGGIQRGVVTPPDADFYDNVLPVLDRAVVAVTLEGADPATVAAETVATLNAN